MSDDVRYRLLDYADAVDAVTLVRLLDAYARDPMGGGEPLSERVKETLAAALSDMPNAFSIVAEAGETGEGIGFANCFVTLSTFAARPLVNIHDLAVVASRRGRGVGRGLLDAVEVEARRRGACKLTLEVLEGNAPARIAYERHGFTEYRLDDAAGTALFRQKSLDRPRPSGAPGAP